MELKESNHAFKQLGIHLVLGNHSISNGNRFLLLAWAISIVMTEEFFIYLVFMGFILYSLLGIIMDKDLVAYLIFMAFIIAFTLFVNIYYFVI